MKNDKVKKWIYLILIFGAFFILRNFCRSISVNHVPVVSRYNRHFMIAEIFLKNV